jgi:phytoene dehydrogenase-like protein
VLAHNAKCFGDQVDMFVNQRVARIELDQAQCKTTGVTLADGKFIGADYVLSNATPHVTFQKLMGDYNLEQSSNQEVAKFFKRVDKIDYDSGTMKINLAVSRLPSFLANPNVQDNVPMPHHQTTIHMNSENMHLLDQAYLDLNVSKKPSSKPMTEMVKVSEKKKIRIRFYILLVLKSYLPQNRYIGFC